MWTHRSLRIAARGLLPALAFVATLSCVGRPVPVEGMAPEPGADDMASSQSLTDVVATLIVENARMVDYRIYLTRMGGERLGMVSGPGRVTFRLRGAQMPHTGELRMVAVPIAANGVLSSSAYIPRGHTARFRIMPNDAYLVVDPLPVPKDSVPADSTAPADTTKKPIR